MPAIILGLVLAVGIILVFVGFASSRGGSGISARLERYTAGKPETPESGTGSSSAGLGSAFGQSVALARFNKIVEQRDFAVNLAREIARADLRLKVSEYLAIWLSLIVGVPLLFLILGVVLEPLKSPIALIVGAVVGFFIPRFWLGRRRSSRLNTFNKQLPDTITLTANALRAGSSFLQAIEMVVREGQPPVTTEFSRVVREVNLGIAFEAALENMVRRVRSDDLELMTTAITIQHQVGGNLAEILDSIAFTIRERVRIKGEIKTLTSQQRMSGYVVAALPIGLIAVLMVLAPSFMQPMFEKPPEVAGLPAGLIVLALAGLMMFTGFIFIRRIVDIEV
jgi:tight adherence protein B